MLKATAEKLVNLGWLGFLGFLGFLYQPLFYLFFLFFFFFFGFHLFLGEKNSSADSPWYPDS